MHPADVEGSLQLVDYLRSSHGACEHAFARPSENGMLMRRACARPIRLEFFSLSAEQGSQTALRLTAVPGSAEFQPKFFSNVLSRLVPMNLEVE